MSKEALGIESLFCFGIPESGGRIPEISISKSRFSRTRMRPPHAAASFMSASRQRLLLTRTAFELSRWRGVRRACDTADIMDFNCVLNRLSPLALISLLFSLLRAKVDSIPIA
jgi:hypothetical protein